LKIYSPVQQICWTATWTDWKHWILFLAFSLLNQAFPARFLLDPTRFDHLNLFRVLMPWKVTLFHAYPLLSRAGYGKNTKTQIHRRLFRTATSNFTDISFSYGTTF